MTQTNRQSQGTSAPLKVEHILVVPRAVLESNNFLSQGFVQGASIQHFEQTIRDHAQYHPRYLMEEDEQFKQIIPYFVFMHDKKLFLMQRSSQAGEKRLAGKYTLGIGGHVRQADLAGGNIAEWGMREFEEEVSYSGQYTITPFGLINDDSNAVGRVHLGAVYLVTGASSDIAIRSELASGVLADKKECDALRDRMEGWSALVYDALIAGEYL